MQKKFLYVFWYNYNEKKLIAENLTKLSNKKYDLKQF